MHMHNSVNMYSLLLPELSVSTNNTDNTTLIKDSLTSCLTGRVLAGDSRALTGDSRAMTKDSYSLESRLGTVEYCLGSVEH
jgi:hypothetical protein